MKIFGLGNKEEKEDIFEEEVENNNNEGQIAVDIIENPNEIIIVSPIAGVELNEIDVSLQDGVLIISGERLKPFDLYLPGSITRVGEVFWGNFSRNIILPDNLDLDKIEAILEKNILIIKIPKLKFKLQSIKIKEQ